MTTEDPAAKVRALWQNFGSSHGAHAPHLTLPRRPSDSATIALVTQDFAAPQDAPPAAAGGAPAALPRLSIAPQSSADVPHPGTRDILVTGFLGEGGMGRVLLAQQRSLDREVAVKVLHPGAQAGLAEALIAEGVVTGFLEHPNIVPVHALGLDAAGQPLLVMKRLTGVVWDDLIHDPFHPAWERLATLPRDRLRAHIEILMDVCQALSFAHSRGVVHRDVKPENVMIGDFGEVYLLDFGVALRFDPAKGDRQSDRIVGTPTFMAREMVDPSLPVGPHTDVYLLGSTLHQILTRRPRHEGETLEATLIAAYLSQPVEYASNVPQELAELCNAATRGDPAERPASALVFRQRLRDHLEHESSLSLTRTAEERLLELERTLDGDPQNALRAASEARFGFLNALREWPNNPQAEAGLRRCLLKTFELEVRLENVAAARALLSEVQGPPAALLEALNGAELRVRERSQTAERLRRIDRESDLEVAASTRRHLMFVLAGLAASIGVAIALLKTRFGFTVGLRGSIVISGAGILITIALVFKIRDRLYQNAINRRLVTLMFANLALSFVHRIQLLSSAGTVVQAYQADLVLTTLACVANGVFVHPSWFRGAGFLALGVLASLVWPQTSEIAFGIAIILTMMNWALGYKRAVAV